MDESLSLLAGLRSTRRRLAAGETLFRAGDAAHAIFHVAEGCVRLVRHGANGLPVTLHVAEAGGLFAEAALFSEVYHCDAVAERASVLAVYPKTALLLYLRAHPDLNLAFSAYLARQVQRLRGRVELIRLKTARERVLAFLTQAGAAERAVTIDRPLTVVASEIGLTHEALYRTLAKLERQGAIRREGRRGFSLPAEAPTDWPPSPRAGP